MDYRKEYIELPITIISVWREILKNKKTSDDEKIELFKEKLKFYEEKESFLLKRITKENKKLQWKEENIKLD